MVCVAIYPRFLDKNGLYSCQLIFSRTKEVPQGFTQPRSELYAALVNAHTGEILKRSLRRWNHSAMKFTDSQIVLHWIINDEKPMRQLVRNRIVEIRTHTTTEQWSYVKPTDMIADIGTRKGATINDVDSNSTWVNGFDWMKLQISEFSNKFVNELRLTQPELSEVQKESHFQVHYADINLPDAFSERYKYSKYIIDPNSKSFTSVVKILALIQRFIKNCKMKLRTKNDGGIITVPVTLKNEEIINADNYFFKKATQEILHFLPQKKYKPISTMKGDILYYNGRILPSTQVSIVGRFTNAMLDLTSTSFCVPVIDKNSPVAFSIVSDVHWNSTIARYAGVETTLRETLKKTFIHGRSLVKLIKKSCQKCKFLNKATIEAAMGPIPESKLTIAPSFFFTQLNLSGPYKAFSPHNKRTTIKVWLVVYCCCVTSAVAINLMDDYSTTAFIQSFIRFSSRHGFPSKIYCDEGSQLMEATKDMKLSYNDIKFKLNKERGIDMETCPVGVHNMHGKVERKIKESMHHWRRISTTTDYQFYNGKQFVQ